MQNSAPKSAVGGARRLEAAVDATGEQLVEIWSYTDESGTDHLELVEHSWGSGIGWYPQKRLTLDAAQVQMLRGVLDRFTPPAAPTPLREGVADRGRVLMLPFVNS